MNMFPAIAHLVVVYVGSLLGIGCVLAALFVIRLRHHLRALDDTSRHYRCLRSPRLHSVRPWSL